MLTLLMLTTGTYITLTASKKEKIWPISTTQTSFLFLISSLLLYAESSSPLFAKDSISNPLIILSFWLIPVSILASRGHLSKKSSKKKQLFMTLMLFILVALIMTFSTTNLMVFFMGFECTLLPTLFLMSRWGAQQERIEAGYYFVFYTLASSLPLLLALITLYKKESHLSIPFYTLKPSTLSSKTLALFCLLAFLVKVPVFGLHLWLPKAHVEAPVAGSMILAAILLKLGGYGFMRLTALFKETFINNLSDFLIPFCCWGGALTSLICLTQTDLKSLMAYSSVSHMSFMIAGMSAWTSWGVSGGIVVMIAHGLVSSALFCIAKLFYERTGTRKLSVSRGMKKLMTLMPYLWLMFAAANLGLPPLPKAMGEIFIFSGIMNWKMSKFLPTMLGIVLTGIFSLYIYQQLKSGTHFSWKKKKVSLKEREYTTLILHLVPLILLITKPKMMTI